MTEIAHAAIDAGADIVVGHGPHYSLPVEVYRGKPIFYGLGSFSFHTGHGGRQHGDWIGMMARIETGPTGIEAARFRFVRHNAANETVPCALAAEGATFDRLAERSARLDTSLTRRAIGCGSRCKAEDRRSSPPRNAGGQGKRFIDHPRQVRAASGFPLSRE